MVHKKANRIKCVYRYKNEDELKSILRVIEAEYGVCKRDESMGIHTFSPTRGMMVNINKKEKTVNVMLVTHGNMTAYQMWRGSKTTRALEVALAKSKMTKYGKVNGGKVEFEVESKGVKIRLYRMYGDFIKRSHRDYIRENNLVCHEYII